MEDVSRDPQLEKLTSELSWLKRLACALVRDENDANDLVQETWLVAAEHAPTDGRPLKPWLSRVALNVVRMRSRASKRRRARETAVESFAENSPTPDELVSRVEAQRIVVDEVLRLAEPYRNTVLLHYFEDLSSAEIARRFKIPEGTVRRRLKVALDELRGRLHAEERKTGRAVLGVLAPLAVKQSAASAGRAALGVVLVKKAIAVVVVVVGLFLVGSRFYNRNGRTEQPVGTEPPPGAVAAASQAVKPDSPAAHIVVAVTDEAGPVANAIVRCAPVDGEVVVGTTASDGNATIDLAAGQWSIAASADGHEPSATTLEVVAARDDKVRLVLAPGGRMLTGIVTDASGGPIAGARIDAAQLQLNTKLGTAVAVASSDRDGRYKLTIGGGAILVAVSHAEYAPQTRYVDLGASGANADFALVPGGVIEGVVRDDQTKQPVAGATVRAISDSSALELAEGNVRMVKSDVAGKFRFAGLRPGTHYLFAREGARITRAPVGVGLGVAEQQPDVVVLIGAAATLRGTVVDDSGAPAPKVTVHALGGPDGATAISDAAGAFVLEGLSPGRWVLRGTSDRYISDGQAIVPLAKTDVDGIVVRVRHGLDVAGHVEPRQPCDVEISQTEHDPIPRHDSMTTSADGNFHFAPFAPGKATLVARCPNGDQGKIDVAIAAGGGESVVPVAPGGSMAGRVVDASGKPVEGVMVTAESVGDVTTIENGIVSSGFKAITSTGGAFEIRGLAAASYRLAVLESARPMKTKKPVKVALSAGQHATGVELVVERSTGTIRGTVTGPDGAPIADAWVSVNQTIFDQLEAMRPSDDDGPKRFAMQNQPIGGSELPPVLTDARGQFALTNLLQGKYQVVAEARSGKLRGRVADVITDAQITIRLASVSSLRGTVHGPRGPTELFSVHVEGPTLDDGSFTDGAFSFARLDPGDYTVDVTSTDGTGRATVHISSNEAASVDITLVPNGTVSGRVVDKAGKPLAGRRVSLIPDQPPGQLQIQLREEPATSGADGRFQVEGPPGMRTLVVSGRAFTAKRGISVAAGNTLDIGDVTVDDQP